jgi:hypothetical protein
VEPHALAGSARRRLVRVAEQAAALDRLDDRLGHHLSQDGSPSLMRRRTSREKMLRMSGSKPTMQSM